MNKIFKYLKNKKALNINKYNKRISSKLNKTKQDFEIYILLNEFNKKYNLNIDDIGKKEINLKGKNIKDKGLKYLNKIVFKEINILNLSFNEISDINLLQNINLTKLKNLDLGCNLISNINVLEKIDLRELNEL